MIEKPVNGLKNLARPRRFDAFEVTGGLHAGARMDLRNPLYTIGSSVESDIVLRDPGIAPLHARLRRKGNRMEVEAVGGDVALARGAMVPAGHGSRCKLPVEILIGDARIRLTSPKQPKTGWTIAAALSAIIFAVFYTTHSLSLAKPESTGMENLLKPNGRLAPIEGAPAQRPANAGEAEKQLRSRLAKAGITALGIKPSNGRLLATGTIPIQQSGAWTEIQSWFDRAYGGRVLLVSDVAAGTAEQAPRLALQAIWYGDNPYIITSEGSRYSEGALTNDGWTIKQIGEAELLLTKGGATVALKYP